MTLIHSIKGRLLLWIFLSVATLLVLIGISLQQKTEEVVFKSIDRTLHSKLQIVKGLMHEDEDYPYGIEFEVDEMVWGEYTTHRSGHYFQIFVNGEIASISDSMDEATFGLVPVGPDNYDEHTKEWIYEDVGPDDEAVRIMRHDFIFSDKAITILVAESFTEGLAIINSFTRYLVIILPLIILLVGIVSFIIASYSISPIKAFSSAIESITHKTLTERIEEGNQTLELQGLAKSFNSLLTRLQTAFESEKHLIADAAHELKTPLTVIRTQCDISLQRKRTSGEYQKSLQDIKFVSETMLRQINGMLILARLDSGMLSASNFGRILLGSCIENAVRLVNPLAQDKNIQINKEVHGDILMSGDKDILTEAILNILENAVSYTMPGGLVDIEVYTRNMDAVITIKDNGIGIKAEDLKRIFDRFYRSEDTRSMDGTGLGLSISRAIIEAHLGTIEVDSEVSRGSNFKISIPLRRTAG